MILRLLFRLLRRFSHPYRKGDLLHADGSLYMERRVLFETRWISARLHHIASEDLDPHLHDHPWNFLSLVLTGGYWEMRPLDPHRPAFFEHPPLERVEACYERYRGRGSVAFRRATDRHRITAVDNDTWTLVIYGPVRHWWGFFTPAGKIFWKDYESVHSALSKEYRGARV